MIFNIEYVGDYYFIINGDIKTHINDINIDHVVDTSNRNELFIFIRKLKLYKFLNKCDKHLIGFRLSVKFKPSFDHLSLYPHIHTSLNIKPDVDVIFIDHLSKLT